MARRKSQRTVATFRLESGKMPFRPKISAVERERNASPLLEVAWSRSWEVVQKVNCWKWKKNHWNIKKLGHWLGEESGSQGKGVAEFDIVGYKWWYKITRVIIQEYYADQNALGCMYYGMWSISDNENYQITRYYTICDSDYIETSQSQLMVNQLLKNDKGTGW